MLNDKQNVSKIINEYEIKIKYFFQSKVTNHDDIEDLIQETLFQIIKSISHFNKKSSLSTWIYSICRNTLYRYYYQKKRSEKIFHKLTDHFAACDLEKSDVKSLIENLEKPLSTIYDLYYNKNYKIKEIAKILDKPEGTIKYLLYSLRIKIKQYYINSDSETWNV